MQNANLLLYMNLSGEVFYIIAHRMKSQNVKKDLQQKVYNDLAVSICHPSVVQHLVKGSLQLLNMGLSDIQILMDRIVHSSIMTVNAYSMEKLFELTLIATRYQYTVCQFPKDILPIALNHLDTIRQTIDDPVGIQMCENLHRLLVDKLQRESSMLMQQYRYAILTYLADVKLKMTNLIKLNLQKPTGEFVKKFPDSTIRPELRQPGKIELFGVNRKNSTEDEIWSESSDYEDGESTHFVDDFESMNCQIGHESNWNEGDDELDYLDIDDDGGCHFENIAINIHGTEIEEDDEILEVEFNEDNQSKEIQELGHSSNGVYTIRFSRNMKEGRRESSWTAQDSEIPFVSSLELGGDRGTILGQSIYEIPGNADDGAEMGNKQQKSGEISGHKPKGNFKETDMDAIDLNAVQGLALCSMMLGCENSPDMSYKSPLSSFRTCIDSANAAASAYNNQISQEPNTHSTFPTTKSPMTGINVVKFDARTNRSESKSALSKISKEFDIGWDIDETPSQNGDKLNDDLFSGIVD